jgi:hypothetical protein
MTVRRAGYRAVRVATGLAVGALYFWIIGIGAEGRRFAWHSGLDGLKDQAAVSGSNDVYGYYDLLGRAFANGKLRLPVEPSPALLALADPWSDVLNRPYRLLDAVLYKRHYYLYHGATPALLLFTPFYLITRHDLPENFATFLLAIGGYLFLSALFTRALAALSIRLPVSLYALFLAALGVAQSVPFLLHRVKVYEVAIACGYFCLSAGFYFTFRLLTDSRMSLLWAVLAGLSFGLAIGARPHLGIAAFAVLVLLLFEGPSFFRKDVLAFIAPVILCGLTILAYNYARFDNPLEFGTRYLMGSDAYRNFHLSTSNFVRGAYYLLVCPPEIVPEFPFVRLALGDPLDSFTRDLTAGYFLEPIGGVLTLCPLILVIFIVSVWCALWTTHRVVFGFLMAMLATVAGTVLVLVAVPFSSQRYDVDFLPYLVFIACVAASVLLTTARRKAIRIVATTCVSALLLYSITANLALGVQGPYDQFVQSSPASYVNLARWFSPIDRFRPLLNPVLHVGAVFDFTGPCPASKQPLISTGEFGSRYMLSAECAAGGRILLISQDSILNPAERSVEVPFTSPGSYEIGLDYTPNDNFVTVTWNRNTVFHYALRFLVTAPSQVHLGWDPSMGNQHTFQGRIKLAPSWIWDTRE